MEMVNIFADFALLASFWVFGRQVFIERVGSCGLIDLMGRAKNGKEEERTAIPLGTNHPLCFFRSSSSEWRDGGLLAR
jgi:hypothetical protein